MSDPTRDQPPHDRTGDRPRGEPGRPKHPGQHPAGSGRSGIGRWIGIVAAVLLVVGVLVWLLGGDVGTPGQEHTLGEPAGVGVAGAPEAGTDDQQTDDPQAAIGPAEGEGAEDEATAETTDGTQPAGEDAAN